jgi:soluble lytic murein transglycosylase-like protein
MKCLAGLVVGLALSSAHPVSAQTPRAGDRTVTQGDVRLFEIGSVRRLIHTVSRRGDAMSEGERAAALADVVTLAEAVVGAASGGPFTLDEIVQGAATAQGPRVRATPGLAQRDEAAYQLLALGYSARETADIVSGRITQQALDVAQRMIALGQGREAAADFLDTQYKLALAARSPRREASRGSRASSRAFDPLINHYAGLHRVEPALIRAIMHTESAFNPAARSHAGAIGLMQLMPSTARELGVNPFVPEQNIEGGVRYFSQLLRMFGGVELALVAYNAGPGFAQRYARGQVALYGETREYVRKVLSRFDDR